MTDFIRQPHEIIDELNEACPWGRDRVVRCIWDILEDVQAEYNATLSDRELSDSAVFQIQASVRDYLTKHYSGD